jgi:NAD(P)-dependent dehydrogenase (short-subunit alcohol dehydrogenase family)
MKGKIAIVTGGARGIGAATARLLAREGASVVVTSRNAAGARALVDDIVKAGGEATAIVADVASSDDVRRTIDTAVERFGGLHVLVNNAATIPPSRERVVDLDLNQWERELRVNLTGSLLGSKYAIPHMIGQGGGSIIHISSTAGLLGDDLRTAYGTSKAGLLGLSRSIAVQYGKQGIRSNVIAPGFSMTQQMLDRWSEAMLAVALEHTMTPRLGTPEDQAAAVLFLASDESAFITGQVLAVDGGLTTHLAVAPGIQRIATNG